MAMLEMRSILCRVAMGFDIAFAPGEDTLSFQNDHRDYYTMQLPPLRMVFTPRA